MVRRDDVAVSTYLSKLVWGLAYENKSDHCLRFVTKNINFYSFIVFNFIVAINQP